MNRLQLIAHKAHEHGIGLMHYSTPDGLAEVTGYPVSMTADVIAGKVVSGSVFEAVVNFYRIDIEWIRGKGDVNNPVTPEGKKWTSKCTFANLKILRVRQARTSLNICRGISSERGNIQLASLSAKERNELFIPYNQPAIRNIEDLMKALEEFESEWGE